MAPTQSLLTGGPVFSPPIHQSCLNCWVGCKRKALYIYRYGLHPKRLPLSEAMTVGSLTHSILYHGPNHLDIAQASKNLTITELTRQITSGEDAFGDNAPRIQLIEDSWSKSCAIAQILWDRFPPNPNHKLIAGEEYLILTLPSGVRIAGTLDRIILDTSTNTYWIRDYKISGRDVSFTVAGYRWSSQPWLYKLLLENHLRQPCSGFILDIIQKPTIKLSGEDCDTVLKIGPRGGKTLVKISEPKLSNYIDRCRTWYKDRGDESCRSFCELFPPDHYLSVIRDIDTQLLQLHFLLVSDEIIDLEEWPRDITGHHCHAYERLCDYYLLCNSNPQAWRAIIEAQYRVSVPETADQEIKSEE